MFNNPLIWLFICIGVVASIGLYTDHIVTINIQKTKQLEIQLKIEMVKAGITNNIPMNIVERP